MFVSETASRNMATYGYKAVIPRYRTVSDCLTEIKRLDPETAVSLYFIRNLAKESVISSHRSGSKLYINLDNLIEYLSTN